MAESSGDQEKLNTEGFFILHIDDYIKCTGGRTGEGIFSSSTVFFTSQSVVAGCRNRTGGTCLAVVTDMPSPGEPEQNQAE